MATKREQEFTEPNEKSIDDSLAQLFSWMEICFRQDDATIFSPRLRKLSHSNHVAVSGLRERHMKAINPEQLPTVASLPDFWQSLLRPRASFPDETDYFASIKALSVLAPLIEDLLRPYIVASLISGKIPGRMQEFERKLMSEVVPLPKQNKPEGPLIEDASQTPSSLDDQDFCRYIEEMRNWPEERAMVRAVLLLGHLSRIGGPAPLEYWLERPNALLGGERPSNLLGRGEWAEIADLIDDLLSGAPPARLSSVKALSDCHQRLD